MKKLSLIIFSLGLLMTQMTGGGSDFITPKSPEIPAQISEFYEDYNFICSYSTPSERTTLLKYMDEEETPKDVSSIRLTKVLELMRNLGSQIYHMDPKMIVGSSQAQRRLKNILRSNLIEVSGINLTGKKAVVEVIRYGLEDEEINRYISQYEENKGDEDKIPPYLERLQKLKAGQDITHRKEYHKWIFQQGKWRKAEDDLIMIKDKKYSFN